jgi:phosphoribosylamine--glycine ligase
VVVAAAGYPERPRTGDVIAGLEDANALDGVDVIHAGTADDGHGEVVSAGGRVLAVTGQGDDLAAARERAYQGIGLLHLDGAQYRTDIARGVAGDAGQSPS